MRSISDILPDSGDGTVGPFLHHFSDFGSKGLLLSFDRSMFVVKVYLLETVHWLRKCNVAIQCAIVA